MARRKKQKFKVDKHALTPKHQKVSEREKAQLLEKYSTTVNEFPKIFKSDPAILSVGAKPGDLVKITRKSATAGEIVFYRVVVDV